MRNVYRLQIRSLLEQTVVHVRLTWKLVEALGRKNKIYVFVILKRVNGYVVNGAVESLKIYKRSRYF